MLSGLPITVFINDRHFTFSFIILKGSHLFRCPEPPPAAGQMSRLPVAAASRSGWWCARGERGKKHPTAAGSSLPMEPSLSWGSQVPVRRVSHPMLSMLTAPLSTQDLTLTCALFCILQVLGLSSPLLQLEDFLGDATKRFPGLM